MLPSQSNLLTDGVWPNQIEESVLYVAYGSCMSPDSLSVDLSAFERIGPVSIPERRIAFSRYSLNRKGGVADLVHCSDQIAEGILYKIPISELEQLDAREGAPYAYRRVIVEVGCDGLNLPVLTYEVSNKSPEEHAPHPDYVKLIMDGADQLSLEYRDALMAHIKQLQAGKGEV